MYCASKLQCSTCPSDIHSVILCFSVFFLSEYRNGMGGVALYLGLCSISEGAIVNDI